MVCGFVFTITSYTLYLMLSLCWGWR